MVARPGSVDGFACHRSTSALCRFRLLLVLLHRILAERMQEIGSALRVGGGGEDCSLIPFQDGQPVADIGGMVLPDFRRDTEISAKKRRPQFGNQFFASIAFITHAFAPKITVKAALVFGPVNIMPISA